MINKLLKDKDNIEKIRDQIGFILAAELKNQYRLALEYKPKPDENFDPNDFDVNVLEVWVGRENNDKIAIRNCTSNVLSEYEIETSPILNKKFYNLKFRWLPLKNIKKN